MKIMLVSGSRADYGGIKAVYDALKKHPHVQSDLWDIGKGAGLPKPMSSYNMAVVLGDRSEILKVTTDIYLEGVVIAHLSGGDITEGSQDDCMRHAITKLAHLHFPTNFESAKRIIQMGEEPWRVKMVGCPSSDSVHLMDQKSFEECKTIAGLTDKDYALVIWHPDTLVDEKSNLEQVALLTKSLDKIKIQYLIIGPNTDNGSHIVHNHLKLWAEMTNNIYSNQGFERAFFLTLLANCRCLIGNSSCGIYEAPSFGIPVVNIGDRQKGRIKPPNIIDCNSNHEHIAGMINIQLTNNRFTPNNPFSTGRASDRIADELARIHEPKKLLKKRFYNIRH